MTDEEQVTHTSYNSEAAPEPAFVKDQVDWYFTERVEKTWGGGHIMQGRDPGDDAVMLVTNDYLNLANDERIIQAQIDSLDNGANATLMSAVYLHGESPQLDFERRMADWMGYDTTVLSQSGYAANVGVIQSIGDADTPAYIDMAAHASLWEGVNAANMTPRAFRHNNAEHLETQIKRYGPGLVLVDSVYSVEGSVAPLEAVIDIANRYECAILVDESHSLGTHGATGYGMVAELGLQSRVHLVTASLAKTFAGRAGIIACSERLQQFIKFNAFPAIFSSALLPQDIAGLDRTLDVIQQADDRRERLHANAEYLRRRLDELGYNLGASSTQIISLESGHEQQTMILRDALESEGVFGSVFCAPATPGKRSCIRLSVNADHTSEQLEHVVNTCADIRERVDMPNWPSTRRKSSARSAA